MKVNPANAIKDFMWDFVKDGHQKPNIPALKESVYDLIQLTTQKTGGQQKYKKAHELDFADLDMALWSIVIEATCLVLSGELDKLEDTDEIELLEEFTEII